MLAIIQGLSRNLSIFIVRVSIYDVIPEMSDSNSRGRYPGDLKRTGTSCQIEIHFPIKTTKFLFKYTLLCSQIYDRFIIPCIKHNHKVSASFIKEKQRYK